MDNAGRSANRTFRTLGLEMRVCRETLRLRSSGHASISKASEKPCFGRDSDSVSAVFDQLGLPSCESCSLVLVRLMFFRGR